MIDWLIETLLASSLLMALVLLVREQVRRHFGPSVAYGLWLIPALRLLMPPVTETVERTISTEPATPVALQSAHSVIPAAKTGLIAQLGGWELLALSAWLAGAAAMLIGGFLIYRWQRGEVLRDSVQLALLGKIRLVRSPAVRGPMAFGIFDRVVALPIDFDDRFDPNERRLAFDHELAHHRSGDLLVSHFAFALLCLQWFNPLAWLSHTAFRFDQEAACDARVLDKADSENRAAYVRAITKAASGPALLFAGALDRPRTLHRRLASMLSRPSTGRRLAGKALIALTAAAASPLTASRVTKYVDVLQLERGPASPGSAGASTVAPSLAPGVVLPAAAAAAAGAQNTVGELSYPDLGGVNLGKYDVAFMADDTVLIDRKRKSLEQLSAAERSRLRATILKSQREQARERAELPKRLAEAKRDADRARSGELRREHMGDIEDLRRDLANVDSEAAEMRANGEDPERRKAEIRNNLREAETTDIASEEREAIAEGDPNKIIAELRTEEQQMARMLARLQPARPPVIE